MLTRKDMYFFIQLLIIALKRRVILQNYFWSIRFSVFIFKFFIYICSPKARERCSSGLRGTLGKRVYSKRVPGVRIPFSPHFQKSVKARKIIEFTGFFIFGYI